MKKDMVGQLVYIKWKDASHPGDGNWMTTEEVDDFQNSDHSINSVGWVIRENKEEYIISSQTSFTNQRFGHIERIPRGVVIKIVIISNDMINRSIEFLEEK